MSGKSKCSICGSDYENCDHIKRKAYMGEMCVREITEIKEVHEVSIGEEPVDKRCRILSFSDKGTTKDPLSWRTVVQMGWRGGINDTRELPPVAA